MEIGTLKLTRNRIYFLRHTTPESDAGSVRVAISNGSVMVEHEYRGMKNFLGDWMYLGIIGA